MRNPVLTKGTVALLVLLTVASTGCRRRSKVAPTSPEAAAPADGTAAAPASHPGEALDPVGLKLAREQFERKMQRPPNDWHEMIDAKVISALPKRKDGQPLDFSEYTEFYIHRGGKSGKH